MNCPKCGNARFYRGLKNCVVCGKCGAVLSHGWVSIETGKEYHG